MLSKIICTIQPLEESMAAIVLWNKHHMKEWTVHADPQKEHIHLWKNE